MGSRIDDKFTALRAQGFTGAMPDMTLQWLKANGATSNCIPDAWAQMLTEQGLGDYQRNDAWYLLLAFLGFDHPDHIADREAAFWADGGIIDPPPPGGAFTDDFNRPDENLDVSEDWVEALRNAGTIAIRSNQITMPGSSTSCLMAHPEAFDGDTYAQTLCVAVDPNANSSDAVGVCACIDPTGRSFYMMEYNGSTNDSQRVRLRKYTNGSGSNLATSTEPLPPGSILRIEIIGDDVVGYYNGVEKMRVADTDHDRTGHCGVFVSVSFGRAGLSLADDYECGSL